jgi:hypothetical protein
VERRLLAKVATLGAKRRTRDGGEVNHGVDTTMDLIDTRQCLHHLAVVSEIGADEWALVSGEGTRSKLTTAQSSSIKAATAARPSLPLPPVTATVCVIRCVAFQRGLTSMWRRHDRQQVRRAAD